MGPASQTRTSCSPGARAGSSSGCREAAPRPALRIEDLHRGVRDRRQSLWRLLEHSPQFACGGLIIYTDVRGEGVKTRLCAAARHNRSRVALSDKCRSTCGRGYGSELTRRGGGDHGHRQKRVWGSTNRPPSCTSGSTAAAPYEASIFKGERKGGMCELPKASDRLGSDRSPHFKLAHRKLLRVLLLGLDQCVYTEPFVKL